MKSFPHILFTPGEPAGIGPDIVLTMAQQSWQAHCTVVADPDLLLSRAKQLGLPIRLVETDGAECHLKHSRGVLTIIPVKMQAPCEIGLLNPDNAHYVIDCLTRAADLCLQKKADAMVTGPVQKSVIQTAGIPFTGHTEFLAAHCGVKQVIMLFVVDSLKVALVTTHLPLADVPKAITKERLLSVLRLLGNELKNRFHIPNPRILVCGLNPHAGEQGQLGREEIECIEPALREYQKENKNVQGPLPADTIFTEKYLKIADAVLAMYHDQALPVVKYMGFHHAVNVTLGLPIIRTSVDHGTALDIAGLGQADSGSLFAATRLAIELCKGISIG